MANFGHCKFVPVFLGKIVGKIQNGHFWPFQICTSLFGKNCQKKFRMADFGHSKFVPVFLGKIVGKIQNGQFWPFQIYTRLFWEKIVGKNSEQPFLAISNLYQSFWGKLSEKIQNGHFWPFQICTSLSGENCQKIFGTVIFGHSDFFLTIFLYISL